MSLDKEIQNQLRKELVSLMDSRYFPILDRLARNKLEEIELIYKNRIDQIIDEAAKKFFSSKQKELAETLTKVIELLAIK